MRAAPQLLNEFKESVAKLKALKEDADSQQEVYERFWNDMSATYDRLLDSVEKENAAGIDMSLGRFVDFKNQVKMAFGRGDLSKEQASRLVASVDSLQMSNEDGKQVITQRWMSPEDEELDWQEDVSEATLQPGDIRRGDYVDFGGDHKYYVHSIDGPFAHVTPNKEDRLAAKPKKPQDFKTVRSTLAKRIIQRMEDKEVPVLEADDGTDVTEADKGEKDSPAKGQISPEVFETMATALAVGLSQIQKDLGQEFKDSSEALRFVNKLFTGYRGRGNVALKKALRQFDRLGADRLQQVFRRDLA